MEVKKQNIIYKSKVWDIDNNEGELSLTDDSLRFTTSNDPTQTRVYSLTNIKKVQFYIHKYVSEKIYIKLKDERKIHVFSLFKVNLLTREIGSAKDAVVAREWEEAFRTTNVRVLGAKRDLAWQLAIFVMGLILAFAIVSVIRGQS